MEVIFSPDLLDQVRCKRFGGDVLTRLLVWGWAGACQRVAAGLAAAAGTPETVVRDLRDYEEAAVRLAAGRRGAPARRALAARLRAGRGDRPAAAFDTLGRTRDLERCGRASGVVVKVTVKMVVE